MGKLAKVVSSNRKQNVLKEKASKETHRKHSVLKPKANKKILKNKREKLDVVRPKLLKTFNDHEDKVESSSKKNKKVLVNEKLPVKKLKVKNSPKLKQNGLKKNKLLKESNDNLNNSNTDDERKEKEVTNSLSKLERKKSKNKFDENKFTPKLKNISFKNKTPKFKVKTALILKQKPRGNDLNTETPKNLKDDTVKSGIKALFKIIEKSKNNKALFDDDIPIFLHFSSVKIGKTPSRTLRIPLQHSLLKNSDEVCLIISDMKGQSPKEYEKTIELCEDMLQEKGVTNIKTIMTYYQLRTDYSEFELKRKLLELYDIFLVDARLSGYVVKKLGKIFRDKRKLPIPIRMDTVNLKEHIQHALSKTSTNLHPNGDNFIIKVAHSEMTEEQVYENILKTCAHLAKQFPGGWHNIRGLNIKTSKSMSIPIYYTLKSASEVPVPSVKAKRPNAFEAVKGELSTANDRQITVLPSGEVKLSKRKRSKKIKEG